MLNVVKNDTAGKGYCGPTVVASITGKPLSEVLDAFRDERFGRLVWRDWKRKPRIGGTHQREVVAVLFRFGYRPQLVWKAPTWKAAEDHSRWIDGPPTLAQWLRNRDEAARQSIHILVVKSQPGHWVAVSGRKLCDTYTKGVPVFIRKAPHRRARVHAAYRVERLAGSGSV